MKDPPVYSVSVHHFYYHYNLALDPARYTPGTKQAAEVAAISQYFRFPYAIAPGRDRALILGGGGGGDVQGALASGVKHVDVVEIDPGVVQISRRFNAEDPYDNPRVSVHIDDKRRKRTHRGAYAKLTEMAHGRPRITEDPPGRVTIDDDEQAALVDELLAGYRDTLQEDRRHLFDRFTEADVVRQVVGVGSVGMRVYLVLLEGRSGVDPLFLQCKQAGPSVYEAHVRASAHANHGQRVVTGKRLVQTATDIFVGWSSFRGHDYYVRQFRDMKIIPTVELIAPRLAEFATACGETLARAHARSGDPVAIAAYLGKGDGFIDAAVEFAGRYADQNDADHAQLVDAIASGAVAARGD